MTCGNNCDNVKGIACRDEPTENYPPDSAAVFSCPALNFAVLAHFHRSYIAIFSCSRQHQRTDRHG